MECCREDGTFILQERRKDIPGIRVTLVRSDYDGSATIMSEVFTNSEAAKKCEEFYKGIAKHPDDLYVHTEDIIIKNYFDPETVSFNIDGWIDWDEYDEEAGIDESVCEIALNWSGGFDSIDIEVKEYSIRFDCDITASSSKEALNILDKEIRCAIQEWKDNQESE